MKIVKSLTFLIFPHFEKFTLEIRLISDIVLMRVIFYFCSLNELK